MLFAHHTCLHLWYAHEIGVALSVALGVVFRAHSAQHLSSPHRHTHLLPSSLLLSPLLPPLLCMACLFVHNIMWLSLTLLD